MLVGGICMMAIGSPLEGGVIAAAGAVNVASWARRLPALSSEAQRALLGLEIALLVACLGLFVWYARTVWDWF